MDGLEADLLAAIPGPDCRTGGDGGGSSAPISGQTLRLILLAVLRPA